MVAIGVAQSGYSKPKYPDRGYPRPGYPKPGCPNDNRCADPNQEYRTDSAIATCARELCTTFPLPPDDQKCPDIRLASFLVEPGCICRPGYAQVSVVKCEKIGSCKCPEVVSFDDTRYYDVFVPE